MDDPRFLLFGSPVLTLAGESIEFVAERRFQLLAYLAFSEDWVERDRLAGLFWPDHDNTSARRNVRKVVYRARAAPWLRDLETRGESLRWPVQTDVALFRQALTQGRQLDACALYRGPLLTGLDDASNVGFTNWLSARRASLHLQWRDALLAALPQLVSAERVAAARRLYEDDPFDERAVMACLSALCDDGKLVEARALYRGHVHRLAEELGVEPAAHLREAARSVLDVFQPTGIARSGTAAPVVFPPAAKDVFVGRRIELQELLSLIGRPECRVITVFGPGGIGKSRLARQALPQLEALFAGAVRWIALEDLTKDAAALARVAAVLGVPVNDAADPVAQIAAQCAQQRTLLVFDNAEHMPSFADVLQRLLTAWPALRLVVTSRARIDVADEWLLPLGGLAVPDADSRDLEAAAAFDAVRLFDVRARTVRPEFELAAHLASVIEVAERVDGMPLAIEMAAAWVRLLPPSEIARELSHSVEILQRPSQASVPERVGHGSVRAVFDHSWKLIVPSERDALAKASVFKGGFRREAATAVTGVTLPVLASLADKSLLAVDEQGRFSLHPLVACFAAERLATDPDIAADCALRHATYWAGCLDELTPQTTRNPKAVVRAVTADLANCQAAWHHAVRSTRPDLVALMLPAMYNMFATSGRLVEGCQLMREALVDESADQAALSLRLRLLTALSAMHYLCGDVQDTEALSRTGLDLARRLEDQHETVRSLVHLGIGLNLRGYAGAALPYLEEALVGARTTGDRNRIANVLFNLALTERMLGGYGRAMALNDEALGLWRESRNSDGIVCALNATGNMLRIAGQFDQSCAVLKEALALCVNHALAGQERHVRMTLGHTLIFKGEHAAAREHLEFSRRESENAGQLPMLILSRLRLARLDFVERRFDAARAGCRWIVATARAKGMDGFAMEALALFAELSHQTGDFDTAVRLWQMLSTSIVLDRSERDVVQRRLDAHLLASGRQLPEAAALDFDGAAALLDPVTA